MNQTKILTNGFSLCRVTCRFCFTIIVFFFYCFVQGLGFQYSCWVNNHISGAAHQDQTNELTLICIRPTHCSVARWLKTVQSNHFYHNLCVTCWYNCSMMILCRYFLIFSMQKRISIAIPEVTTVRQSVDSFESSCHTKIYFLSIPYYLLRCDLPFALCLIWASLIINLLIMSKM